MASSRATPDARFDVPLYSRHRPVIERVCTAYAGPFVYHLNRDTLVAMNLDCTDCVP